MGLLDRVKAAAKRATTRAFAAYLFPLLSTHAGAYWQGRDGIAAFQHVRLVSETG
jgi:hypothetical protein